jgi:ectoine hydroxylase-related dioxygenase (phytanoyl-CoA dioxygenase family)
MMDTTLDQDTRTRFAEDGAVVLRGAISADWLETLREGVRKNIETPGRYAKVYTGEGASGFFFGDYCNWDRIGEYRKFLFDSGVGSLAASLMGSSKVNFFHEHVLVKEPQTEEPTPWHHDQPYWVVDGTQVCSIWIPLDPVARDVCVQFIAGSHRWGKWFTPKSFSTSANHDSNEGDSLPDIADLQANNEVLTWDMEPGDCIAFHALTLHGAPGNRSSTQRRRAIAMRFTGDDATFTRRDGYMSPPFESVDLTPGDPMDSEHFPIVYDARA